MAALEGRAQHYRDALHEQQQQLHYQHHKIRRTGPDLQHPISTPNQLLDLHTAIINASSYVALSGHCCLDTSDLWIWRKKPL